MIINITAFRRILSGSITDNIHFSLTLQYCIGTYYLVTLLVNTSIEIFLYSQHIYYLYNKTPTLPSIYPITTPPTPTFLTTYTLLPSITLPHVHPPHTLSASQTTLRSPRPIPPPLAQKRRVEVWRLYHSVENGRSHIHSRSSFCRGAHGGNCGSWSGAGHLCR